jgi:hypothetical protein
MNRLVGALALLLSYVVAWAGGAGELVTIEKLTVNGSDYELVVIPSPPTGNYKDPYMGDCARFTVKGGYDRMHTWRLPEDVTRESHMEAIAYMQQAHAEKKPITLGWMGTGFMPIGSDKCVVRSRALQMWKHEPGPAVVSYHNEV